MKEPVVLHLCQPDHPDLGDHDRPAEDRGNEQRRQDEFPFEGRLRKGVHQSPRPSCYQRCQQRHSIVCLAREPLKAIASVLSSPPNRTSPAILEIPGFRLTGIPSCQSSLISAFRLRSWRPGCSSVRLPLKRKTSTMSSLASCSPTERSFIQRRPPKRCKRT